MTWSRKTPILYLPTENIRALFLPAFAQLFDITRYFLELLDKKREENEKKHG